MAWGFETRWEPLGSERGWEVSVCGRGIVQMDGRTDWMDW